MPKTKPIAKFMDTCLKSNPKQANKKLEIQTVSLPKGFCAPILVAKKDVLILKFEFDHLFGVFIE